MSTSQSAIRTDAELSPVSRHLLQLCAVYYEGISRTDLVKLSNRMGWTDASGKQLVFNRVKSDFDQLIEARLLVKAGRSSDFEVNPEFKDAVVQEVVREGQFDMYVKAMQTDRAGRESFSYLYSHGARKIRDMRIAFYRNDVERFNQLNQLKPIAMVGAGETLGVLQPFHTDLFQGLDPALQTRFLAESAEAAIVFGEGTAEALQMLEEVVAKSRRPPDRLVTSLLDIYMARGDLGGLQRLAQQTGGEYPEIAGCAACLQGRYEQAESDFEAGLKQMRKRSRKRRLALRHMAGLFHVGLLIRKNSPADRKRATSMLQVIHADWHAGYKWVAEFLTAGLKFQATPADAGDLFRYQVGGTSILAKVVAGYVCRWFGPRTAAPVSAEGWQDTLLRYQALGLDWAMAETAGLLAHCKIKQASDFERRHRECHEALGTVSMLHLIEPEARWQRSLKALMQLQTPEETQQAQSDEPDERLIWEVSYNIGRYLSLRPFLQKRNKSGAWTKGRPVALKRLYELHGDRDAFPHLTEQDQALCRCIKRETSYGGRGRYADTDYFFETDRVAVNLIGHPLVFREDDRSQPLDIVRREPQLVVAKRADGKIRMSLEPRPGSNAVQLTEEGPNRLGVVHFTPYHLQLGAILDGGLTIPASGHKQVLETVQAVAPLVTVHSEIGGASQTSDTVDAEPQPYLHLTPYQEGVRVEFFVRPFGPEGPFYRPGAGGENVYAQIAGQTRAAHRDLREERRRTREVIAACPALSAWVPDLPSEDDEDEWRLALPDVEGFGFPKAGEALELMLQVQPLIEADKLTLHWPTGGLKAFRVVGEAGMPQLRLNVRKDRDWFAASGSLQMDDGLTVDVLQLVEWLGAARRGLSNWRTASFWRSPRRCAAALATWPPTLKKAKINCVSRPFAPWCWRI